MVFYIPIDFCIEFWNSTFSPVLEYTEEIFLTASVQLSNGASVQKVIEFFFSV